MSLYDAFYEDSQLGREELSSLAQFSAGLEAPDSFEKSAASPGSRAAALAREYGPVLAQGLIQGGTLAATGMAAAGAVQGGKKLYSKATQRRDLKRLLSVHPEIAERYDDKEIALAFNSVRHFNEHLTKEPLAAGALVKQILRDRDPHNPSAAPRLDLNTVSALYRDRPRDDRNLERMAAEGVSRGLEGSLRSHGDRQMADYRHTLDKKKTRLDHKFRKKEKSREHSFQRELEDARRDFERDLTKDREQYAAGREFERARMDVARELLKRRLDSDDPRELRKRLKRARQEGGPLTNELLKNYP